jgi:hypothetical protein
VEFSGYLGFIGAFLIMSIMLGILSFAMKPLGAIGNFIATVLKIGLSIYACYMFFNMLGTVLGLRGKCPQGYRSGWPPLRGTPYHRNPDTGLRVDDPEKPLFG